MKYSIHLEVYIDGQGLQYKTCVENGKVNEKFTQAELEELKDYWRPVEENKRNDIIVEYWEDDADPLFDEPLSTEELTTRAEYEK